MLNTSILPNLRLKIHLCVLMFAGNFFEILEKIVIFKKNVLLWRLGEVGQSVCISRDLRSVSLKPFKVFFFSCAGKVRRR